MVAAADTGLVGGRCIRRPGASFIAWTTGMVALTVALLAQSIGFTTGFDPVTFRVIQLAVAAGGPGRTRLGSGRAGRARSGRALRGPARRGRPDRRDRCGLGHGPARGQAVRYRLAVSRRPLPAHPALRLDRAASYGRGRDGRGRRLVRGPGTRPGCAGTAGDGRGGGRRRRAVCRGAAFHAARWRRLPGSERAVRRARLVRHGQAGRHGARRFPCGSRRDAAPVRASTAGSDGHDGT